ncbi:MAG: tripartite tricarboxylate transporter substrate binding protein [Pseudolabrys sp.]
MAVNRQSNKRQDSMNLGCNGDDYHIGSGTITLKFTNLFLAFVLSSALAGPAPAQDWPSAPIRIVVPFPAGGSADVQSRLIADALSKRVGQPVIVDNKPGAGGNIAAAEAAHARPDGYTLFMATTGTHASNISLYKKLPYDPVKDFVPLTMVTTNPQVIVSGEPYKDISLKELIARLKEEGLSTNFGSSGIGSATHIAGELFNRETGTAMVHVPYRGQGPALNDLLGGRLDVMFPLVADAFSFLQSGKLHAFAVVSTHRSKILSDISTTLELGYPGLVLTPIWTALYTNAQTPRPIVDRLNRELVLIISAPDFVAKLEGMGFEVRTTSSDELRSLAEHESADWGELIKALKVHLD